MAKKNGEIATAIATVQQYFARRSKTMTEEVATTASPAPVVSPPLAAVATPHA